MTKFLKKAVPSREDIFPDEKNVDSDGDRKPMKFLKSGGDVMCSYLPFPVISMLLGFGVAI